MHPPVSYPDLPYVGPFRQVDDFLQNLCGCIGSRHPQLAARHACVDQQGIELKALLEDPDRQVERDATSCGGQPECRNGVDARPWTATRIARQCRVDTRLEATRSNHRVPGVV